MKIKKNFRDWLTAYNLCPEDIFLTDDAKELSFWLQSGEKYPPKTLWTKSLRSKRRCLIFLTRMILISTDALNIFNKNDLNFNQLRKTCDALFHELCEEGVGSDTKETEPLTREDEEKLWASGRQLDIN